MTIDEIIDTLVKVLSTGNRADIKLALHAFAAAIQREIKNPPCHDVNLVGKCFCGAVGIYRDPKGWDPNFPYGGLKIEPPTTEQKPDGPKCEHRHELGNCFKNLGCPPNAWDGEKQPPRPGCLCYCHFGSGCCACKDVPAKQSTTEPKESDCPCHKYPEADLRHCTCDPTPELPFDILAKIDRTVAEIGNEGYSSSRIREKLESLAHLCLSMRAK